MTNNQAETFNILFIGIAQNLKIAIFVEITQTLNTSVPVLKAMKEYEKHSSIIKVKEKMKKMNRSFSF